MTRGMLAIWSDVEAAMNADYLHWLTREHAAERVGTAGFEAVRVLRADRSDIRRYLILYDLADASVLGSPAYMARLNDPTPWSRRIMPCLRNFARGGGTVVAEAGCGQGGHVVALRLDRRPAADGALLRDLVAVDQVCAARLLDVDAGGTGLPTSERALRGGDATFPGLLLIEALDAEAARDALARHRHAVASLGAVFDDTPGYTAFFTLRQEELRRGGSPPER